MTLAELYPSLKATHVGLVVVSVSLLVVRSLLGLRTPATPLWLPLRVLPHVVDTGLLASAVALAILLHQAPFVDAWLTAKVLALVAYVVLGTFAVRRGRTPAIRLGALAASLLTATYMILTAIHHDPAPWRWG